MSRVRIARVLLVGALALAGAFGLTRLFEPALSTSASAQPAPAGPTRTDLPCYERAERETTLTDEQALFLCRGARSLGPFECYEEADDETTLADREAIRLCRCAQDVTPVRCYERADRETLLTDAQIVEQCRPIRANKLGPRCIPLRAR